MALRGSGERGVMKNCAGLGNGRGLPQVVGQAPGLEGGPQLVVAGVAGVEDAPGNDHLHHGITTCTRD